MLENDLIATATLDLCANLFQLPGAPSRSRKFRRKCVIPTWMFRICHARRFLQLQLMSFFMTTIGELVAQPGTTLETHCEITSVLSACEAVFDEPNDQIALVTGVSSDLPLAAL